ncbi:unnamed protein product [Larinioides sclopetarius]|uniref:Speckle-type POZ protein n=1 Tax=Larinioides sclopetarius TaxID=280406 RepID=A0AAV2AJW6_9ARAC
MNNEIQAYTITWFIENYSYCWHKQGEVLKSPEFTGDVLEGTIWTLQLYPRGDEAKHKGNISLYLTRNEDDDGPEDIQLKYNLSILATDESDLRSSKCEFLFRKGDGYGAINIAKIDEVLILKKSDYLNQDTLIICCKIMMDGKNIQPVTQINVRTSIGIEQILFFHIVEDFSELKPSEKKIIQIRSVSKKALALSSSFYFYADSCCEGKIVAEITPSLSSSNQILLKCRLSLLDSSGKKIHCGETDNRFDTTRQDIIKLPLSLTKTVILKKKSEYLVDDKLSLLCECTFSTGVEFEKIERILYKLPIKALDQISDKDEDLYSEQLSECPSALDNFREIYNNRLLNDVVLKTKTKAFPAHKIVLCARSPVFKAMLTNDMKEKNSKCIEVEDVEDDTLQQLLLFLYTDYVENLQWESAIRLYYAGDKYDVRKLKVICSSFLVKNVTASSAGELLLLADTHSDSLLKKFAEEFIFKHEEDVFGSDEWMKLIETNPLLVSKTMCLKYLRKL